MYFISFPFIGMNTLHSSDHLRQPAVEVSSSPLDAERKHLIRKISAIVDSHYKHGAESVSIATVPQFMDLQGCEAAISSLSFSHLQYVHGLMTGRIISRPSELNSQ